MIKIKLDIPDAFQHRARYVFNELALRWHIPITAASSNDDASVAYSPRRPENLPSDCLWMRFDEDMYQAETICSISKTNDDLHCWVKSDQSCLIGDLIGGVWRLLSLLDESQVSPESRDYYGSFFTENLPVQRQNAIQLPLVEEMARYILNQLKERNPSIVASALPAWQNGKKWALLLTSDADSIHLGDPRELAFNFAKMILRRKRAHAEDFWAGLKTIGRVNSNPHFKFKEWQEFLAPLDLPITYFLFLQSIGVPRKLNDCRSSVDNQPVDWRLLKNFPASKVEFGLHPSIMTRVSTQAFSAAKEKLESFLDKKIIGVRHHYLALDWLSPTNTFKRHIDTGFTYDATIAYRDTGGFRAGTSIPYQPYDINADQALRLIEIPFNLMDVQVTELSGGNSYSGKVSIPIDAALEMFSRIRTFGGIVHLNWHQETFWNRGSHYQYIDYLKIILDKVLPDSSCWLATLSEMADWRKSQFNSLIHW